MEHWNKRCAKADFQFSIFILTFISHQLTAERDGTPKHPPTRQHLFLPIPRLVVKPSSTMSRKKCPPSPPWNLHQEIHQPLPDLTGSKRGRRSTRSGHQEKLQHSSVLAKELLDLAIMMRNGKERMTVVPQLFFQHQQH